jgi:hypothetical protein
MTKQAKPKNMRNTRTGKVIVYNPYLIEEMPWYEPIIEEETQPEQVPSEPVAAEKPKRKTWKDAVAEKAQELAPAAEEPAAQEDGDKAEQA